MSWSDFLTWMKENQIGDITGVLGIFISVLGFAATIIGVIKSKNSAQRAELAANSTRDSIKLFDTVVDFSSAISILEEIKRNHRNEQWEILLDRYSNIRKILVTLRAANKDLTSGQQTVIQTALTNLTNMEEHVEKNIGNTSSIKAPKLNSTISKDIDNLVTVLIEIKSSKVGARK